MQVYNIPIDADKKENTRHGDISLPMAIYETDPKKIFWDLSTGTGMRSCSLCAY